MNIRRNSGYPSWIRRRQFLSAVKLSCHASRPERIRFSKTVFYGAVLLVFAFTVLGRSAAYAGIPPLYGGEITIILFVIMFARRKTLAKFLHTPVGFAVVIYTLLPLPYFLFNYGATDLQEFGLNAAPSYYAVFIYCGYAAVRTRTNQRRYLHLLYYVLLLSACHNLLSVQTPLREISPLINGVPLLGNTDSSGVHMVGAFAYLVIFFFQIGLAKSVILFLLSVRFVLLSTSRAVQLCVIGLILLLSWHRKSWMPRTRKHTTVLLLVLTVALSSLLLIELFWGGLVTKKVSTQLDLLISTIGYSPNLRMKSGTKQHRLDMWKQITETTVHSDPLFGQGFSAPLTDAEFRNPHNSLITIFGRMGFLGLSLALFIYFALPLRVLRRVHTICDPELRRELLFYLCYVLIFLVVSLTGPTLVSPFSALTCNFTYGLFLRCFEFAGVEQGNAHMTFGKASY